ncbi:MAG: endonuclease YncB(thermonuclease family) [Maritalea sp.]|jgi:endonuclease YncB( thermonuclease family)
MPFRWNKRKMEVLIIFAFVVLWWAFGSKGRIRKRVRQLNTWTKRKGGGAKRRSFDSKTARLSTNKTILKGRAYIVDGDTLVIQKTQVRLFGVDAPELSHPYGQQAKWALVSLCRQQIVVAETLEYDDYGRTVARCYLQDGRDISAEMVKIGLAIDWPKFSGGAYRDLELAGVRKRLWLADARQKGRLHVWETFNANHQDPTS